MIRLWKIFGCVILVFITSFNQYVLGQQKKLISYTVSCPDTIRAGDRFKIEIKLDIQSGWHVYAPHEINKRQDMHPIRLEFQQLPSELVPMGELEYSEAVPSGPYLVYRNKGNTLAQWFVADKAIPKEKMVIRGKLVYQACNEEVCLPPMDEKWEKTVFVTGADQEVWNVDSAWNEVERSTIIFPSAEESQRYANLKPLDMKRYEDEVFLRSAKLALDFWKQHPHDPRRLAAMKIYMMADPWFISKNGNELLDTISDWREMDKKMNKQFFQSMVIDTAARNEWLKQGELMVNSILLSADSSMNVKEEAAFAHFARDFRLATRYFHFKDENISDTTYWAPFLKRFFAHMNTYPRQSNLDARAKDFLSVLAGNSAEVTTDYWEKIRRHTSEDIHNYIGFKRLHDAADEYLYLLDVKAGAIPMDMSFTSLAGSKVDLKALRGKLVLIDFWATWCKPCLAELPHLKKMYDKYRDQGFEVVGICLDEETVRDRVNEILAEHQIDWTQRFEGVGFNNDAYKLLYDINSLPTVWLLDRDGKIISRNARGKVLEEMLRELLAE